MAQGSGFFKGEKRKKKKGENVRPISAAPVFTAPVVVSKGKSRY